MKNYVYIYHSESDTTPSAEAMEAWNKWFETLGSSVVDSGNPITTVKAVLEDGDVSDTKDSVVGYSIVKATDLDEATELAKDCPLANAPGCKVCIYETGAM